MMMRVIGVAALVLSSAAQAQTPGPAADTMPAPKPVVSKQDKVICRTSTEIGSLVATNKICKTRREWNHVNDDLRMRGPVGNCAGGGGPAGGTCQY